MGNICSHWPSPYEQIPCLCQFHRRGFTFPQNEFYMLLWPGLTTAEFHVMTLPHHNLRFNFIINQDNTSSALHSSHFKYQGSYLFLIPAQTQMNTHWSTPKYEHTGKCIDTHTRTCNRRVNKDHFTTQSEQLGPRFLQNSINPMTPRDKNIGFYRNGSIGC